VEVEVEVGRGKETAKIDPISSPCPMPQDQDPRR
jgi:hypothetical protein